MGIIESEQQAAPYPQLAKVALKMAVTLKVFGLRQEIGEVWQLRESILSQMKAGTLPASEGCSGSLTASGSSRSRWIFAKSTEKMSR
jgi:hypothetical protein